MLLPFWALIALSLVLFLGVIIFLVYAYQQIKFPNFHAWCAVNHSQTKPGLLAIGQSFLDFNNLKEHTLVLIDRAVNPFHHSQKVNKIIIGTEFLTSSSFAFNLNFLLGQLFLTIHQVKNSSQSKWWQLIMWWAGPIVFYLYWLCLTANLIFSQVLTNTKTNNQLMSSIQISLMAILLFLNIGWGAVVWLGSIVKTKIEVEYAQVVTLFLQQNYPDLIEDNHLVRRFCQTIKWNFRIGIKKIFEINPRPLGPFSML